VCGDAGRVVSVTVRAGFGTISLDGARSRSQPGHWYCPCWRAPQAGGARCGADRL